MTSNISKCLLHLYVLSVQHNSFNSILKTHLNIPNLQIFQYLCLKEIKICAQGHMDHDLSILEWKQNLRNPKFTHLFNDFQVIAFFTVRHVFKQTSLSICLMFLLDHGCQSQSFPLISMDIFISKYLLLKAQGRLESKSVFVHNKSLYFEDLGVVKQHLFPLYFRFLVAVYFPSVV